MMPKLRFQDFWSIEIIVFAAGRNWGSSWQNNRQPLIPQPGIQVLPDKSIVVKIGIIFNDPGDLFQLSF